MQWPARSPTPGRLTKTFRFSAGLLPRRGSGRHVLPMPGDQPRPPAPGPVHSRTVFPPPVRLSCRPALGGAGSAAILAAATRNRQVLSQPTRMPHVPKKVGGHRCGGGLRSAVPGRAGTWYQGRSHTEEERPRSAASRGSARTGSTPRRRSTRGPAQGSSSLTPNHFEGFGAFLRRSAALHFRPDFSPPSYFGKTKTNQQSTAAWDCCVHLRENLTLLKEKGHFSS